MTVKASQSALVEVLHVFVSAHVAAGDLRYFDQGMRVDVLKDDAERLLALGAVRLVDVVDAAVPTGDEQSGDEGEAGGTDAAMPLLNKPDVIRELEKIGAEFDKRWGVDRLRGVLDAALDR